MDTLQFQRINANFKKSHFVIYMSSAIFKLAEHGSEGVKCKTTKCKYAHEIKAWFDGGCFF